MRLLPKRLTVWRRRGQARISNDLAFLSPEERKQLGQTRDSRKATGKGKGGRFRRPR